MKSKLTYDISLVAFFTTLLVISSWFTIPFVIPFTLQTLVIFICILVLNLKKSILILIIYFILGVIGIPVFNSFQSGIGVFVGPTGGFLIGFIPMIIISTLLKKVFTKTNNNILVFLSLFIGLICCYIISVLWYILIYDTTTNLINVLSILVLPFIIPDIIKIIIAMLIAKRFSILNDK